MHKFIYQNCQDKFKMKKKGQAATEYIMISAFALLVIVPATYFFYTYSNDAELRVRDAQISKLATDIANNAEHVYYLGYPSKQTLEEVMPSGVKEVRIDRDWKNKVSHLTFLVSNKDRNNEYNFPIKVNTLADFGASATDTGTRPSTVTPGIKNVRIFALNNKSGAPFVLVTLTGSCFVSTNYAISLAACGACSGQQATGVCEPCDYDGSCAIDNRDLVLQKIVTLGNSAPTASISGGGQFSPLTPVTFNVNAKDADSNMDSISIFMVPMGSVIPVAVGSCGFAPSASASCSKSYSFAPGSYYVYAVASDTNLFSCTGTPNAHVGGVDDCGFYDFVEVKIR